jgi:hypothetical protein
MAQLGGTFDATNVAPKEDFDVIPLGLYPDDEAPVMIVKSDMEPTKAGTGQMLVLEMDIIDGPAKGRKFWDRLNLVNPNPKAVEIAERTLSAICHATGRLKVSDSDELHGIPMLAKYKIKPAEGQYKASNEISTYKPRAGSAQPAQDAAAYQATDTSAAPTPPPASTGAAPATPPWRQTAAA